MTVFQAFLLMVLVLVCWAQIIGTSIHPWSDWSMFSLVCFVWHTNKQAVGSTEISVVDFPPICSRSWNTDGPCFSKVKVTWPWRSMVRIAVWKWWKLAFVLLLGFFYRHHKSDVFATWLILLCTSAVDFFSWTWGYLNLLDLGAIKMNSRHQSVLHFSQHLFRV